MNLDLRWLFLSTTGRIGRFDFWLGGVILALIESVAKFIIAHTFGLFMSTVVLAAFVQLIVAYFNYGLCAKRLQDRGYPGTYAAVIFVIGVLLLLIVLLQPDWLVKRIQGPAFVPIAWALGLFGMAVGVFIFIELGCLRGTRGPNAYGPESAF